MSESDVTMLDKLRLEINAAPQDADKIHLYYQKAVALNQIDSAKTAIAQMQAQFPWNQHLRKIFIALSLHQKDYACAMAAVEVLVAFSKPDNQLIDSALSIREHLGPLAVTPNSGEHKTLSLCMIVKNEQAYLPACLHSIKSLVDEMIIVDTGSEDRSVDLAKIYGARSFHYQWCDDFSGARNYSLEMASGDWILVLDADELIASEDFQRLRDRIDQAVRGEEAFAFITRNYSNLANTLDWQANDAGYPGYETGLGWYPTDKVRLFPRSAAIRFQYPVHELVEPSIRAAGMRIVPSGIPIHHYGHINEKKNQEKAEKYFRLGYAKLEQMGQDKAALRELAVQAGQLKRWSEAITLWQRLLKLSPQYGQAYANISGAHWQLGNYEEGAVFAKKAIELEPHLKEGHYNLAVNLLFMGAPQKAADILQNTLRQSQQYLAAHFMLAVALCIIDEKRKIRSIMDRLNKQLSNAALAIALNELAVKFNNSGFSHYAAILRNQSV